MANETNKPNQPAPAGSQVGNRPIAGEGTVPVKKGQDPIAGETTKVVLGGGGTSTAGTPVPLA